jgi:nucleotide-binding universal stress UspA family protein
MESSGPSAYRKLMVAFDGSDGARTALVRAAALGRAWDAELVLAECTGAFEPVPDRVVEPPDPARAEAALAGLKEAAAALQDPPRYELRVVEGHPPEALLALAEEVGADLVVTGSRGKAMLRQAALGRVSSTLVSRAACDVLVVQPEEEGGNG